MQPPPGSWRSRLHCRCARHDRGHSCLRRWVSSWPVMRHQGCWCSRRACDERVLVSAHVVSIPQRQGSGWQFDAQVNFPRQPGRPAVTARVTSSETPGRRPHAGELWTLALQLRGAQPAAADATDRRVLLRDGVGVEARLLKSAAQPAPGAGAPFAGSAAGTHRQPHWSAGGGSGSGGVAGSPCGGRDRRRESAAMAGVQCHRHHAPGRNLGHARDVLRDAEHGRSPGACGR